MKVRGLEVSGADLEPDLYGEADAPTANGHAAKNAIASGPATISLSTQDVLTGIGRISDIEFGIAVTDQGVSYGGRAMANPQTRTYPQLVAVGGGSNGSTINVFRVRTVLRLRQKLTPQRGIPITKKRRFDQLSNATASWFLPVERPSAQKFKGIPEAERTTMLFSSDGAQTRVSELE